MIGVLASLIMELSGSLEIETVCIPYSLARLREDNVSAVSPDCDVKIANEFSPFCKNLL